MNLPEESVEIALFKKAQEYTTYPLYFPNESAPSPDLLTGHIVVSHFRNGSTPYSLAGDGDAQFMGILQMLLKLPRDVGPNEMRRRGAEIVSLFWTPTNLSLWQDGVRVRVAKRPVLGTGIPTDTMFSMPVSIYYEVFL